jgi:Tfp pilus assembly protein PilN
MRAVNLLPRDAERTGGQSGRRPLYVAVAGIAAVTAAAVLLATSASEAADARRSQLAETEAALAAAPRRGAARVAPGVVVQERADRVAALAAALSTRVPVDRVLRDLSYVLPADAWLTGLTVTAPASAPTAAAPRGSGPASAVSTPLGVTIQGATYSYEAVARVLGRLAVVPSLENVRLAASAHVRPQAEAGAGMAKKKAYVTFTVTAELGPGGRS